MYKFISLVSIHFLILCSLGASTGILTRHQYETIQLYPRTLHTISETKKPGLILTCSEVDAPKLKMGALAFLLHTRENLVRVWLIDLKITVAQFTMLVQELDKLRLDSNLKNPIDVVCTSEQSNNINAMALEGYNCRNMTLSTNIH